jgi:hypothetical protein
VLGVYFCRTHYLVHVNVPLLLGLESLEPLIIIKTLAGSNNLKHVLDSGHHTLEAAEVNVGSFFSKISSEYSSTLSGCTSFLHSCSPVHGTRKRSRYGSCRGTWTWPPGTRHRKEGRRSWQLQGRAMLLPCTRWRRVRPRQRGGHPR